eukprot:UN17370
MRLSHLRRSLTLSSSESGMNVVDHYRNSLSWILNENESIGNRVSFYFTPMT